MATFGDTTNGGADGTIAASASTVSNRIGFKAILPENGIATSISVYLAGVSDTVDVTVFLNSVDTVMNISHPEIVKKETLNLLTNVAATWFDFDIADTSLIAGQYILSAAADGSDIAAGILNLRKGNTFNDEFILAYTGAGSYTSATANTINAPLIRGNNSSSIYCTYTALPTVTISIPTSITSISATANGNIITIPGGNCTLRGFVYGTTSKVQPNNVSGASSGYDTVVSESGSYGTGTYSLSLTGLIPGTTYYIRPFVQDTNGYSYGQEIVFTTTTVSAWLRV